MADTFYWHDYETWGADPSRDRPAQFAGLRTDADLNPIGDPLVLFSRPSDDLLPQPEACLITGITPQQALAEGLPEAEFITRIQQELMQPGTCGVGYNSIRFDDEVTRYTLYRNFFDPYAREWRNGNSRWDLIDALRMAHALRPEGIEWPTREDGATSFRLEVLSQANGIAHDSAHDALSDVQATIGLARLLKQRQPRLFDYALSLRRKKAVKEILQKAGQQPFLHVSSKISADLGCIAPVTPLAPHPSNGNAIIVFDLRCEPDDLLQLDVEQIRERVFTRIEQLPEGVTRLPLKALHINKSPMLAPMNTLSQAAAERWRIDPLAAAAHAKTLHQAKGLASKLQKVFAPQTEQPERDPDQALYGAFIDDADRPLMDAVRNATPEQLAELEPTFMDSRLPVLLFRYRARNWPESLAPTERALWDIYRKKRFKNGDGSASIGMREYEQGIAELLSEHGADAQHKAVLQALQAWGEAIGV